MGVYQPGCLVIEGEMSEALLDFRGFEKWPLVILVDSVDKAIRSDTAFLWTVFTRFEPAADIHAKTRIVRNHIAYSGCILIDARMKEAYPPVVTCAPQTAQLVTQNWNHYFPEGMEMGESDGDL